MLCRSLRAGISLALLMGASLAQEPLIDWLEYERGQMGTFPMRHFESAAACSPYIKVDDWHDSCDADSYTLLTPRGKAIPSNRALILDTKGDLVWFMQGEGAIDNLQVQRYNDEDYLTYWTGDDEFYGHGSGYYKMLDRTYTLSYTIRAGNGLPGDYHDFTITRDNTALITIYHKRPWDLTRRNRKDGYIWDCLFQEIDIPTNKVLVQWSAADHFSFQDMTVDSWTDWTGTAKDPWDWFHLNSVEKDSNGDYMISARYTNAISLIDGATGDVKWTLGGAFGDFTDIENGKATSFVDPHMARWTNDSHVALTVYDNVAFWTWDEEVRRPHGMQVSLNFEASVAFMTHEFLHNDAFSSGAGGSLHTLPNGNHFIGYGSAAIFAEFSFNGTFLCSSHFAPLWPEGIHDKFPQTGLVQSYRTYKQMWNGFPETPAELKITDQSLFASWNGATDLHAWEVHSSSMTGRNTAISSLVGIFPKSGFETEIPLGGRAFSSLQVSALDVTGSRLRSWDIKRDQVITELLIQQDDDRDYIISQQLPALMVVFVCVGCLVALQKRSSPPLFSFG